MLAFELGNEEPGLGETILRIVDALEVLTTATRRTLAAHTGKTPSAIGRACRRAQVLGILSSTRKGGAAKKYSLLDWNSVVEELRPILKTYMLGTERAERMWEGRQWWAVENLNRSGLTEDEWAKWTRSRERAISQRKVLGSLLHPELTPQQLLDFIMTPKSKRNVQRKISDVHPLNGGRSLQRQVGKGTHIEEENLSTPGEWLMEPVDGQEGEDQATFLDRLFAYVPSKAGVRAEISSEVIFDIPYS